jgi:hypothetical protein
MTPVNGNMISYYFIKVYFKHIRSCFYNGDKYSIIEESSTCNIVRGPCNKTLSAGITDGLLMVGGGILYILPGRKSDTSVKTHYAVLV